jgi:AcrR family transcriptional regulator
MRTPSPRNVRANFASFEEPAEKDTRTKIRDKARHIFERYGYRKTTIEDIGKACGFGKAALYHYFTSKEEIFAEVVRAESDSLLSQMRRAVAETDDPKAQIVAMVKTRFKIIGDAIVGRDLADEFSDLLPLAANARQAFFREEAKLLAQILREGQRRGVFRSTHLGSMPVIMISAFRGIEMHLAEVQDAPALDESLDALLRLFFEGLCK